MFYVHSCVCMYVHVFSTMQFCFMCRFILSLLQSRCRTGPSQGPLGIPFYSHSHFPSFLLPNHWQPHWLSISSISSSQKWNGITQYVTFFVVVVVCLVFLCLFVLAEKGLLQGSARRTGRSYSKGPNSSMQTFEVGPFFQ